LNSGPAGDLSRIEATRRLQNINSRTVKPHGFGQVMVETVTPAKAGVQFAHGQVDWIPAYAGMTGLKRHLAASMF
jgi:hypothetical protein